MIGRLSGKIDLCFDDHLIIDVSGVGYLVYCSAKGLQQIAPGEFCQLFIETHVREDHITLYGFLSIEEKKIFNILLSVSGIGPRLALSILSHLLPEQIQLAVNQRDQKAFTALPGVGLKLAERIIIELKDKVLFNLARTIDTGLNLNLGSSELARDAISALTNLGINKLEAHNLVVTILSKDHQIPINQLIMLALKARG